MGGTYHNFLKNETTKYIEHATATSLSGPWRFVGTGDWAGWGSGLEGPALVRLPDNRWRLYFDQYGAGRYYSDSADLPSFGSTVELTGLSGTARRFTVLREESGDGTEIATGNRSLRSAHFPDRHVRHLNGNVRIDPVGTATERADATFTVRSGLANGNCYSFQSVNNPGRHPRHDNCELRLDQRAAGSVFAGDASFTVTAPLS
ncbi:AbfB domain-containing protein [Actinokineospora guangxiensis]|uniref:AbfB domain-containing protein n=1 Tax=Actinokineospora guangxiensis TaxID=1490288 RepID=A0ABW0EZX3_9PSEU